MFMVWSPYSVPDMVLSWARGDPGRRLAPRAGTGLTGPPSRMTPYPIGRWTLVPGGQGWTVLDVADSFDRTVLPFQRYRLLARCPKRVGKLLVRVDLPKSSGCPLPLPCPHSAPSLTLYPPFVWWMRLRRPRPVERSRCLRPVLGNQLTA